MASLKFNSKRVLDSFQKPYIVAEVNSSHGGKMDTARDMIKAAADCGCDCVKFQSWSKETLYSKTYYDENPIAKRFVSRFSLKEDQLKELAKYCKECGVDFASTPYSNREAEFLVKECQVPFVKISSMELNNYPFLEFIAKLNTAIVLSTGMGDIEEIKKAVEIMEQAGNTQICLLHCVSNYPTELYDVNLRNISGLQQEFPQYPIGFSDHTLSIDISPAAIAMGSCLIEKHFTLDRKSIGMDNQMAIEPEEMKKMVSRCLNVYTALGTEDRKLSESELCQREKMRRSLVYVRDMKEGEVLQKDDLDAKRPGRGIPPNKMSHYVGRILAQNVTGDTLLMETDFK